MLGGWVVMGFNIRGRGLSANPKTLNPKPILGGAGES